ncbi:MAG: mannosylglycerate synthase domain-containing protein, partial [Acidimicrobiia bacterium]
WGIDTVLTYATAVMDLGLYEHHVADGKRHALYGSLDELREMLIECLDAAASLSGRPGPGPNARHDTDPPAPVPEDLKEIVAYDVGGTVRLLEQGWSEEEIRLAGSLPKDLSGLLFEDPIRPSLELMDADRWYVAHGYLLEGFALGDPAWESLAFRLWLTRVLAYTTNQARKGFDTAMTYLESTIRRYEAIAAGSS